MIKLNRRQWTAASAGIVAGVWTGTRATRAHAISANEKMNLAFIGVGGRGGANLNGLKNQNVVALCDVDGVRAKNAYEKYPSVKKFEDYRVMLDQMESKIDGVVISTPDHTHFHPTFQALQQGKHVYLEKPMAHNVWEVRTLTNLAREKGVATQLGVQRHTLANMHRSVELIKSGAIGTVNEVYCWIDGQRGMPGFPKDKPEVPDHLNYDLWIGPAKKKRKYHPSITPYGWRFWWDYGTGETGNWGCHILDIPYWALDLKYPVKVSGSGPAPHPFMTPKQLNSTFLFPATDARPEVTLHWDHAKSGPEILRKHQLPNKGFNTLFIGSEGMLLTGFSKLALYPESKFESFNHPEKTIPDSPGFYNEWVTACNGGDKATCHFDYSGPMAETVLLGNVAFRTKSEFNWDAEKLASDNDKVNSKLKEEYREGWEIS